MCGTGTFYPAKTDDLGVIMEPEAEEGGCEEEFAMQEAEGPEESCEDTPSVTEESEIEMESVSETQRTEWLGQALTVFKGPMCDAAYQLDP